MFGYYQTAALHTCRAWLRQAVQGAVRGLLWGWLQPWHHTHLWYCCTSLPVLCSWTVHSLHHCTEMLNGAACWHC